MALGGAFFGESMFYREPDASKVAFVTLVEELAERGFRLVDCQQETAHLERFGAEPIPRRRFLRELQRVACCSRPSSRRAIACVTVYNAD